MYRFRRQKMASKCKSCGGERIAPIYSENRKLCLDCGETWGFPLKDNIRGIFHDLTGQQIRDAEEYIISKLGGRRE